jgi:hypothetical protein
LLDFLHEGSLFARLGGLFARNGEHFVVPTRLAALCSYAVLGQINFKWIILVGNLAVPLCAYLLLRLSTSRDADVAECIPAGLVLIQPQFYQVSLWAGPSVENLWVMPFVLAAFNCAESPAVSKRALAILLSIVACFTQGNGLFAPALVGFIFCMRGRIHWGWSSIVLFGAAAVLHVGRGGDFHHVAHIADYVIYSLSFLGAPLAPTFGCSVFIGVVLVTWSVALLQFDFHRSDPALFAVMLFVEFTALANALARVHLGTHYAYSQSRYTFPAIIGMSATYLSILRVYQGTRLPQKGAPFVWTIAVCGIVFSYVRYMPDVRFVHNTLEESIVRWNVGESQLEYPDNQRASALLKEALREGIYSIPEIDLQHWRSMVRRGLNASYGEVRVIARVEHVVAGNGEIVLSGYAFPQRATSGRGAIIVSLLCRSTGGDIVVSVLSRPRPDVARHQRRKDAASSGFFALVNEADLPAGLYEVRPIVLVDGKELIGNTIKRVPM